MIPYFPPHDDLSRSIPPRLLPGPPIGGFVYPGHPPVQPFPQSYPLQAPHFPPQFPPLMHQQYPHPRQLSASFLADPAFSPDPRSNPHFFSMNDREEIYPASISDSFSDYAPTLPDDESDIDHTNLPPRMRHLAGPNVVIPPRHSRSQSTPYVSPPHVPQNLSRSNSTRVIPVPPPNPIALPSPSGLNRQTFSPDDLHENLARPPPMLSSASAAAQVYWHPPHDPPPYSDCETDSSSSNPQTPSNSPPSSTHNHLPRELKGHTLSAPLLSEKRSFPESQFMSSASSSSVQLQARDNDAPALAANTLSMESPMAHSRISPHNASAPELRPSPAPIDVPPRPSTVPVSVPPPETPSAPLTGRRRNSKNPSISAPPRDLDSIDELDESDPLGFAWHHGGPYEAIARATGSARNSDPGASAQRPSKPRRKPVQAYDSVSVGIAPGQIFPSFSQYQPQAVGNGVQVDSTALPEMPPAENFQVLSPPRSPLALPVQRRVPPTGQPPSTPDQYNNVHMNLAMNSASAMTSFSEIRDSHMPRPLIQQPSPEAQRTLDRQPTQAPSPPMHDDAPQPSPPLPNPYSPSGSAFPSAPPNRHNSGSRPVSTIHPPDLPPSNIIPRPDITLPPQRQQDKLTSLLPRHLPKKLVMPAPLQQNQTQNLQQGQAHVEFLAQRHGPPPVSVPGTSASVTSQQQQQQHQPQQVRAKDIPFGHGPKLLRKKHASSAPQPEPSSSSSSSAMPSNAAAAMFSAKVRFAEPPREETREERKKREKEEARREKEEAKREKARAKSGSPPEIPLQGIFAVDYVKEAELVREREFAKMGAKTGRKLSKRR